MAKVEDPRISAWIVLGLGTGVTVAANILHAQADLWPRVLSGSIPLILLFAAHTAAYAKSWLVRCTMLPVALFAFFISYDHMNALAQTYGEQYEVAKAYPLAVDGALLVATLVLATYRPARSVPVAVPERSVLIVPADQPEQNSIPAVPEQPEQNVLTGTEQNEPVPALTGTEQNSVPDWYTAPEQNRTEHVPAPAFCPPPVLPEQPEQNDEPERNEPEQNRTSAGTSTGRRQNDEAALQLLAEVFDQAVPSTREAQNALKCGASRAERLARIHAEKLSELRT